MALIIVRDLKEMEDARKHLLRRPSLGVRGEKMGGGGRERSFLSLRSIPFCFPASLFSPEAPYMDYIGMYCPGYGFQTVYSGSIYKTDSLGRQE